MNCREIGELAPLYLSGEMGQSDRDLFRAHLAQCMSCASELERQAALDARVREALELPDAALVTRAVRGHIARKRIWRVAAVAAAILIAFVASWELRPKPVARLYADAALDHRLEVMEHQPRRWRSDPAEIERLAARYQLHDAAALAPEGYRLEHAKMCGIDGKPALHLVYTNGNREYSVFVRARSEDSVPAAVRIGAEQLASIRTDRLEAIVVSAGTSAECSELARSASLGL